MLKLTEIIPSGSIKSNPGKLKAFVIKTQIAIPDRKYNNNPFRHVQKHYGGVTP